MENEVSSILTEVTDIEVKLGYTFSNRLLLQTALTHRSFAKQVRFKHQADNEGLEFFGDAIMKFFVSKYLFTQKTHLSEGDLSKQRSALVSDQFFYERAKDIGVDRYIRISASEKKSGGDQKLSILSCAFEAIVAAIYLDSDMITVESVLEILYEPFNQDSFNAISLESKSMLQEYLQKQKSSLPKYSLDKTEGPEHQRFFTVKVSFSTQEKEDYSFVGTGRSKKEAEQKAALEAIDALGLMT